MFSILKIKNMEFGKIILKSVLLPSGQVLFSKLSLIEEKFEIGFTYRVTGGRESVQC